MVLTGKRYPEKNKKADELHDFLLRKAMEYNRPEFISTDPISVPHQYSLKQDIEISAFFAALFSWGNRKTIINKTKELMQLMDNSPFDFIVNHQEADLRPFLHFKHRTFNGEDLLYFIHFLHTHFSARQSNEKFFNSTLPGFPSLEKAFTNGVSKNQNTAEEMLRNFFIYFFSLPDSPARTRKHISTPAKKSACKRLNMFLRWMVRHDSTGVDFGIWKSISPAQLICPLDVHVARVARRFGLLTREQTDWAAAAELTENLRRFDENDPVKFDYALFGLGAEERF